MPGITLLITALIDEVTVLEYSLKETEPPVCVCVCVLFSDVDVKPVRKSSGAFCLSSFIEYDLLLKTLCEDETTLRCLVLNFLLRLII